MTVTSSSENSTPMSVCLFPCAPFGVTHTGYRELFRLSYWNEQQKNLVPQEDKVGWSVQIDHHFEKKT